MLITLKRSVFYVVLTAVALLWMVPFIWMLTTALKTQQDAFVFPPRFIPTTWMWSNFAKSLEDAKFFVYMENSLIMAVSQTLAVLIFSSMAGYAFARLRFPGQKPLFLLLLAKMMIPHQAVVVPLFVMMKMFPLAGGNDITGHGGMGWLNTWFGLLVPGMISAFSIFMFRQFFGTLPVDTEDAARIDGCSEFRLFWSIVIPQAKPVMATLAIFTFQNGWNSFVWPLLVTTRDTMRTIQIGLSTFRQDHASSWTVLMAATTLATLPMLIVFLFGQRYFVKGISMSGMKG